MTRLRFHWLLAATVLLALIFPTTPVIGDVDAFDSSTRLPATCAEVKRFMDSANRLRTLAEVREMSGASPQRLAPMFYRWRLRDGTFQTTTILTDEGEFISCWSWRK